MKNQFWFPQKTFTEQFLKEPFFLLVWEWKGSMDG